MQDALLNPAVQPFLKLARNNVLVWTKFSMSPELMSPAFNNTQLFQQEQATAVAAARSDAFARLMRGLFNNYAEFLADCGQSSLAMLVQNQAALANQVQWASDTTADVVDEVAAAAPA